MVAICNMTLTGLLEGVNFAQALSDFTPRHTRFNGVVIPMSKSTCLLFPNGAVTIVGLKSLNSIVNIPNELASLLHGCSLLDQGYHYFIPHIYLRVCNMVGTIALGHHINMDKLYQSLQSKTFLSYTPESFPGMKVTIRGNLVAIVFHTGKVVLTGAKDMLDLEYAAAAIRNYVSNI